MKIAILSVSDPGKKLSMKLKNALDDDPTVIVVDTYHKNVKSTLVRIFKFYDIIIGIMATGIMVRSISTLLVSKKTDPGIIVLDEKSEHVISLISGHLGGANNLTLKIAKLTGADPVISTATDLNKKIGIDTLAYRFFWEIRNPDLIRYFNQAILKSEKIGLLSNACVDYIFNDPFVADTYFIINEKEYFGSIEIQNHEIWAILKDKQILMVPRKIVLGLGSRKGVSRNQVISAIKEAIKYLKLPLSRIDLIATGDMKNNEKGIIEAATYLGIPLSIVSSREIKDFKCSQCSSSDLVKNKFGLKGVCEPSALIKAGKDSKLIFKKTAFDKVTVAIAISTKS